ncbi:MAG: hypothetical protein HY814_05775 [Candidatus Riflebacteria bacterium]|nr:hypothetical protein [Candidatus Riflebacteria bacterium]
MTLTSANRGVRGRVIAGLWLTLCLAAAPAGLPAAGPAPEGLSSVIRAPTAFVELGTSTYYRGSGLGFGFTYPLLQALEGGLTRENDRFAFHGKVQLLGAGGALPALAVGARDFMRDGGPTEYFWVMSKTLGEGGPALHGGVRRVEGFLKGPATGFAAAEMPFGEVLRLMGEYDWGLRSASLGAQIQIRPNVYAFDHVRDAFGQGKASNVIGLSIQGQF